MGCNAKIFRGCSQFLFQLVLINVAYYRVAVGINIDASMVARKTFAHHNQRSNLYSYDSPVMYNLIGRFQFHKVCLYHITFFYFSTLQYVHNRVGSAVHSNRAILYLNSFNY